MRVGVLLVVDVVTVGFAVVAAEADKVVVSTVLADAAAVAVAVAVTSCDEPAALL